MGSEEENFGIKLESQSHGEKKALSPPRKRHCSSDNQDNRFGTIPEELVEQILLRLDAESVWVCRRVCKSWFHLIINDDPSFVNKHLELVGNRNCKKTFIQCVFRPILSLVTVCEEGDDDGDGCLPCVVEQVPIVPAEILEQVLVQDLLQTHFIRVSHCNGIIHIFDPYESKSAVLFNPVLREFKLVGGPTFPFSSPNLEQIMGHGFGYDPKSNNYKYVKIFGSENCRDRVAVVHTMGTSCSSWREIKVDVESRLCFIHPVGDAIYCKGAYYWHYFSEGDVSVLLCFDMCEEIFRSIQIPDCIQPKSKQENLILGDWNGSVALFYTAQYRACSGFYELWIMTGDDTHWIKRLKIGPLQSTHVPINFWKDDELLLKIYQGYQDGDVVSYNIYTQQLRRVPFPHREAGIHYATPCLKTLVSL
ncbi:putative F-box/kelch-repeat protein At3g20710 [Humulus lupulus]|uniref:putative F-box/kelch-repeat protein At3g20710 n=1 Tax=Humulus lupulus TaxID=3486 RepID=UPI002B418274|nr:putative F-box/kelch-repeat protein At3g20710 [Humulus lupulus]